MAIQPGRTALYRLFDGNGQLLYVGVTATLKKRFGEHAASKAWWPQVASHTVDWLDTRSQALDA